ncbi:hypothetical protein ACHAWU_004902 [Discostella pseudostelligera]|uniref:N-acetyltransferase domain-containing protein n=1 Tax=Discostella pseudostelligera TaxID=259834 RepID=A0ABD3M8X5_9STRA
MMIHTPWSFIFTISTFHATAAGFTPQRIFPSWAQSSSVSSDITSCEEDVSGAVVNGRSNISSIPKSQSINLAIQEKILENFQLNWGNNADIDAKKKINNNRVNGDDNRSEQQRSPSASEQQSPSPQPRIPFIIENIGRGEKNEIEEIVRLCIDVFFNEQELDEIELQEVVNASSSTDVLPNMRIRRQQKSIPPWKAMQLAYLRNFQTGEILARNAFNKEQFVNLIVARRVYATSAGTNIRGQTKKNRGADLIVDDAREIFNADLLTSSTANGDGTASRGVVVGEIIGYCEVSEKNFGLGGNYETTKQRRRSSSAENKLRPYLSNLSVVDYARRSGVGSKLLDAGEDAVRNWNAGHTEIVLQVEEDNPNAIQFYKRRGWEFVFADPTCRRYDTSGFFLKECRVTKYAMIKRLDAISTSTTDASEESETGRSLIEKVMNSFFSQ